VDSVDGDLRLLEHVEGSHEAVHCVGDVEHDLAEQLVLVGEVLVNGLLRHRRERGDLVHAGAVVSFHGAHAPGDGRQSALSASSPGAS